MVLDNTDDYVPKIERTKLKERKDFLSAIGAKKKYKKEVDICKAIAELAINNDLYKIVNKGDDEKPVEENLVYSLTDDEIGLLPKKMKISEVKFSTDSSGEREGTIQFLSEKDGEVKDFYFSQKKEDGDIEITSA